ncbi:hypothetical protein ACWDAZ_32260, partial [Streptomyces sp. NPDC001215]
MNVNVRGWAATTALAAALLECVPGTPAVLLVPAGLWLLLGAPALLFTGFTGRALSARDGRALIGLGLSVVGALALLLTLNTLLPALGVDRPLERVPLALTSALYVVAASSIMSPPVAGTLRAAMPTRVRAGE